MRTVFSSRRTLPLPRSISEMSLDTQLATYSVRSSGERAMTLLQFPLVASWRRTRKLRRSISHTEAVSIWLA